MKTNLFLCSCVAASILFSTGKAVASTINYVLTSNSSSDTISFDLLSQPGMNLPCNLGGFNCFSVSPVDLTINGTLFSGGVVDFMSGDNFHDGGGVLIQYANESLIVNLAGPEIGDTGTYETLYSGTLSDPTLEAFSNLSLTGYSYFGPQFDENFTLNATSASEGSNSAVPEPPSFVFLGSGLVAFAGMMRRKIGCALGR